MKTANNRLLLRLGIVCAALFWLTTLACGLVHGNYNHISGTISELGALGSKSEYLFSALILLFAALGIGFSAGLYRICSELKLSLIPLTPILVFFLGNIGIALFPLGSRQHPLAGQITIIILLSPLPALWYWKDIVPGYLSLLTLFIFITSLALVLADLLPDNFVQSHSGLLQRIFHLGWTCWFIILSIQFDKKRPL